MYNLYDYLEDIDSSPKTIVLRESVRYVRKPRRLSCGYEAKRGDTVYQVVGITDGEFFMHERCQRCDYAMHGMGLDGPTHGQIVLS